MSKTSLEQATGTWTLDPKATTVQVTVKKLKLIAVTASMKVTSGTITVIDDQVTSVEALVDAGSYSTKSKKRDEHVAGKDFLDAANNPTITFKAPATPGTDQVRGKVTIKDKTSPLVFDVTDVSVNDRVAHITASATADRNELGIDAMPSFVIGSQLDIMVNTTAHRAG